MWLFYTLTHSFIILEGFWNFLVVTHRINKGSYVYISLSPRKKKQKNKIYKLIESNRWRDYMATLSA